MSYVYIICNKKLDLKKILHGVTVYALDTFLSLLFRYDAQTEDIVLNGMTDSAIANRSQHVGSTSTKG